MESTETARELDDLTLSELRQIATRELSTGTRLRTRKQLIAALKAFRAKKVTGPWAEIKPGTMFRVASDPEAGVRAYYFLVTKVVPTRDGGEFAWVDGYRCSSKGRRTTQIEHAHCAPGERRELHNISLVIVHSIG